MQFNPANLPPAIASNYFYSLGAFIDDDAQVAAPNKSTDNDFDYWAPVNETVTLNALQEFVSHRARVA